MKARCRRRRPRRRARWRWPEIVFWLVAFAALLLPSGKYLILNEIAILALFALSLDLILGYAGIVSLGHAAFFGVGAYAAGLFAKHVTGDPLAGLAAAIAAATIVGFVTSFLVLRGTDLTRLMVTLGVALVLGEIANAFPRITGGADGLQGVVIGQASRPVRLRPLRPHRLRLQPDDPVRAVPARAPHRAFAVRPVADAIRRNSLRAAALGVPIHSRLIAVYTLAAAYAGAAGALLAQTTAFVSLDVLRVPSFGRRPAGADHRRRRLALRRHRGCGDLQAAAGRHRDADAAILAVLDRPVPGRLRHGRPGTLMGGLYGLLALARRR